jgi:hypothetical protein
MSLLSVVEVLPINGYLTGPWILGGQTNITRLTLPVELDGV